MIITLNLVIYEDGFGFVIKKENDEIFARSRLYNSIEACKKGINALEKEMAMANNIDIIKE